MGIKTIKLPRKTVRMASHQFMPPPISEDASMYVGIHADIEIHKAAKLASPHFLRSHETGARSSLYSEPARAASSAEASNAGVASMGVELRVAGCEWSGPGIRNLQPATRNSSEVLGFTLQKIAAANCAGELPIARGYLAANSYHTRTALDFPSLKRTIINVHQLGFGGNRAAIVGIEHHQIGVRAWLDRSFAREERE